MSSDEVGELQISMARIEEKIDAFMSRFGDNGWRHRTTAVKAALVGVRTASS